MNKDMVILIAEDNAGHFQLIKKNLWLTCVNNDILLFREDEWERFYQDFHIDLVA